MHKRVRPINVEVHQVSIFYFHRPSRRQWKSIRKALSYYLPRRAPATNYRKHEQNWKKILPNNIKILCQSKLKHSSKRKVNGCRKTLRKKNRTNAVKSNEEEKENSKRRGWRVEENKKPSLKELSN